VLILLNNRGYLAESQRYGLHVDSVSLAAGLLQWSLETAAKPALPVGGAPQTTELSSTERNQSPPG